MKLHYVGPKPRVDHHGVDFDKSEPDRYIFLYAVVELLEAIENCAALPACNIPKEGVLDISAFEGLPLSTEQLIAHVQRHCDANIEGILKQRDRRLTQQITALKEEVHTNTLLASEDKEAWLGNIEIMQEYYRQFVENEVVYECLLEVLAEKIYRNGIKEIRFHVGKNYGFVFSYLQKVLQEHRPPLDATLELQVSGNKTVGHFSVTHPQKLQ